MYIPKFIPATLLVCTECGQREQRHLSKKNMLTSLKLFLDITVDIATWKLFSNILLPALLKCM